MIETRVVVALVLLAGCGGGAAIVDADASDAPARDADTEVDGENDATTDGGVEARPDGPLEDAPDAEVPPAAPLDLRFAAKFARKIEPAGAGFLVLLDHPQSLSVDWGHPARELRRIAPSGFVAWGLASAADRELLDFAAHPSGDVTALFASGAGFRLVRLSAEGAIRGDEAVVDTEIDSDAPARPAGQPPSGQIDPHTHDCGRVAALGEDAVVALRTGRHSVIAHRFAFSAGAFAPRYRTLVVPAYPISPIGLIGGSYDTFGAVEAQLHVHLAVGPEGIAYVGIRYSELTANRLVKSFKDVFGETLATDPDFADSYVTRLAPDGARLGISVVGTDRPDEIFGLRAVAGAAWVLGRNEVWNAQGTGFDALVARVDAETGDVLARSLDVELGDIAFDLAPVSWPGGGVVVVGASGYNQNPSGASISEPSAPFARWLHEGLVTPVPLPSAPRHNEARVIVPLPDGRLVVGGMLDGPGTHSADGNPSLLRADGFLRELAAP
jgi:hypothetical protein